MHAILNVSLVVACFATCGMCARKRHDIMSFRGMSSTPFHNFLFCHFAELMLLWQLVDLVCGGVMLAGL